jgi:hypothetical protein
MVKEGMRLVGKLSDHLLRLNNDNMMLRTAKRQYERMMYENCVKLSNRNDLPEDVKQWAIDVAMELREHNEHTK